MIKQLQEYSLLALKSYEDKPVDSPYELIWRGDIDNDHISILKESGDIYVITTGSNDIPDWFYNFIAYKKNLGNNIRVHSGFHDGLKNIKVPILNHTKDLKFHTIKFIGHSRGGAISQLAAWYFSQFYYTECWSFASPKIGNKDFKLDIDSKVLTNIRCVIKSDFVTMVPKINYYHAGREFCLPSQGGVYKSHSMNTYYKLLHR